ncbi:MAG: citrate synthase/methylcitrate synthase [Rhodobiaceae bacterium]|nr:citrate synthase/methylcitrate synthase [Rhodobiaceae bacterium]
MSKTDETKAPKSSAGGLEGVVAAETALSRVDGAAGRLIIAGRDLPDLAETLHFEGVTAALWSTTGKPWSADEARTALGKARVAAFENVPTLLEAAKGLTITEALRVGLGLLPDTHSTEPHVRLVAAMPVFVAALARAADGKAPVAPDAGRSHAEDYLRMLHGEEPAPDAIDAMDKYLVTVSDHGMNASTFTARVVASTAAEPVSSVLAALCALKGPLHGGAPGPVLDMLDDIGGTDNIEPWLREAVMAGDRLMGFGHRVYRVRDPRADVLGAAIKSLKGVEERTGFARQVEATAKAVLKELKPHRPLDTNVEFYTALLLEALAIPREAFTPTFAVGRVAGWTAHIMEQESTGRLIRPSARYVGALPDDLEVA